MPDYVDMEVLEAKYKKMDPNAVIVTGRKKAGESTLYPKESTVIVRIPTDWAAQAELEDSRKHLVILSHQEMVSKVAEIKTDLTIKQQELHKANNAKNPTQDDTDRVKKLSEEVRMLNKQLEDFEAEEQRQAIVAKVLGGESLPDVSPLAEESKEAKEKQAAIEKALSDAPKPKSLLEKAASAIKA